MDSLYVTEPFASPTGSLPPVALLPRTPAAASAVPVPVSNDSEHIRSLVVRLVKASGLTQIEVSRRMGNKTNTINQYMIGRSPRPSAEWLAKLAYACGGRLLVEFPVDGQ